MPRRMDNSDRGVLITEEAARRLQKVINQTGDNARDIHAPKLRTAFDDGGVVRVAWTTAEWARGATQEVEIIYAEDCEQEGDPPRETVEAYNLFFPVAAEREVLIGQADNGCWYLLMAASCYKTATSCVEIGGQDLTKLLDYDASKVQILGHANGGLKWFNTSNCEPEA